MTKSVRVDPEAEEEIFQAIERYDQQRDGLGLEFWTEVKKVLDVLHTPGPECGPVIGVPPALGVRRKLLARFPYAVVFVETDTFVRVLSVMHGHRRPAYWQHRLR